MVSITIGLLLLAGPATPQNDMPPPGFYAGEYVVLGRLQDGSLIEDRIRIQADDASMSLESCAMGGGSLQATRVFTYEGAPPLEGTLGAMRLACNMLVNGGNYPLLTCSSTTAPPEQAPALLTLWPDFNGTFDCPADDN